MPRKNRVSEVLQLAAVAMMALCAGAAAAAPDGAGSESAALARAMQGQQALVRAWPATERIAGYKIAFGTPEMQRRFALDRPAVAVLPAAGARCAEPGAPCSVTLAGYGRPVVELEVALRLGSAITEAPANEAALLAHVDGVMPAVELPDLALPGTAAPRGLDYIATNIGVRGYIVGPVSDPAVLARGAPALSLARGGAVLASGSGAGALGAALVLVGEALAAGYELRPGQVLLTGAVGGMVPAEPGDYVAQYGALGELHFRLR
jgi:2-keto-4-pentenoate hydratase